MQKIKEYKGIIILILIILGTAFYWYEWRPYGIAKKCHLVAENIVLMESLISNDVYDKYKKLSEENRRKFIESFREKLPEGMSYAMEDYQKVFENCINTSRQ